MNSSAAALLLLKKPQLLHAIVQTVEPPRTTNKIEKIVIAFRHPEWMLEHTQCAHSLQSVSCVLNANVQKKKNCDMQVRRFVVAAMEIGWNIFQPPPDKRREMRSFNVTSCTVGGINGRTFCYSARERNAAVMIYSSECIWYGESCRPSRSVRIVYGRVWL